MLATMLPTINLDLGQLCATAFDINHGRNAFIGRSFAYYLGPLRAAALKANKSLDRIVSEGVLAGITSQPFRTKAVFWYTPASDMVFLTVCDARKRLFPMWLRNLPGYFECGGDFVPPNGKPYLYWNGSNLTRVYIVDDPPEPGQTYLSDFGTPFGVVVGRGNEVAVEQVRANDPAYLEYSIVPEEPDEIVVIGNLRCILSHAFCTLTIPPAQGDELAEDDYAD